MPRNGKRGKKRTKNGVNQAEAFQKVVSIFDVLDVLGIRHHGIGTYQISCPNPIHEDINPSARVYANSNTVFCWTCNKTWDVVELVKVAKDYTFKQACDLLELKFGVAEYTTDPKWVEKIGYYKRNGFVTNKSLYAMQTAVHDSFLRWYRNYTEFPGPLYLFDVYEYWLFLYDELIALKVSNDDKIKLLKGWLSEGKETIERCANLSDEEIRSKFYAKSGAYTKPAQSGKDIRCDEDARKFLRQCVWCFRNNRKAEDDIRFFVDRVTSNG